MLELGPQLLQDTLFMGESIRKWASVAVAAPARVRQRPNARPYLAHAHSLHRTHTEHRVSTKYRVSMHCLVLLAAGVRNSTYRRVTDGKGQLQTCARTVCALPPHIFQQLRS